MTTQKEISATEKLLDLIRASPPPSAVETPPSQKTTTDQRSGLRLEETGGKRDINSALAYPKMVVATLIGAFFFLLTFVIPKFVAIFTKAGIELPLPTKLCLVMYHGLLTYWPLMLGVIIVILAGFKMYFKTEQGAIQRDHFLIRLPISRPCRVLPASWPSCSPAVSMCSPPSKSSPPPSATPPLPSSICWPPG